MIAEKLKEHWAESRFEIAENNMSLFWKFGYSIVYEIIARKLKTINIMSISKKFHDENPPKYNTLLNRYKYT